MPEPIEILWSWVEKIGQRGIDHVFNRLDKAAGATSPANPLAEPLPPALSGIPPIPTIPTLPVPESPMPSLPGPATPAPSDAPASMQPLETVPSYALDVAAGIACVNCLRDHLGTMVATAAQLPDPAALARISAEYAVLMRYDLTPEKIAATPDPHRQVVETTQTALAPVGEFLAAHGTLSAMALTWGARDEAIRFGRSNPRTDRDREEITLRLADADQFGGYVERVILAPEHRNALRTQFPHRTDAEWEHAANALRHSRHVLDADPNTSLTALETSAAWSAQAAQVFTPQLSPAEAQQLQQHLKRAQRTFYQAFLQTMQHKKTPSTSPT